MLITKEIVVKRTEEQTIPTIGVLSAITDVEHSALLEAFGIDQKKDEDNNLDGNRYWITEINRKDGSNMRVVISCIARSGNADPQIPVERMVALYAPEVMFFVGIACGLRPLNLGDVVTSEQIYAYEYSKSKPPGESDLDRSRVMSCVSHLITDVQFFKAKDEWHEDYERVLKKFPEEKLPKRKSNQPHLHPPAWIASGEKVLADGRLSILNAKHDKVRAGEMEGYGFAVACASHRPQIPWLVIRGISDYGDATKDGSAEKSAEVFDKDEYHLAAAVSAATFLRKFLETTYTPETQRPTRNMGMTGTLNDRQIIDMAENGLLISENFSEDNVQQACYELRVGNVYYELEGETKRKSTEGFDNLVLKPKQLTVVITMETLNIPSDVLGRILTKGRLFSVGILPVNTYADPGFQGKLGIVLYNSSPYFLRLQSGEPIAKIEFTKLAQRVEQPYDGQHGYQSEIWPMPENMVLSADEVSADPRLAHHLPLSEQISKEEFNFIRDSLAEKEKKFAQLEFRIKVALILSFLCVVALTAIVLSKLQG